MKTVVPGAMRDPVEEMDHLVGERVAYETWRYMDDLIMGRIDEKCVRPDDYMPRWVKTWLEGSGPHAFEGITHAS